MSCKNARAVGVIAAVVLAMSLLSEAGAVAPLGSAKRVDKDTGTSEVYWFNTNFRVTRTGTGGFAVAWEDNTISEAPNPIIWEDVRFRVYDGSFAPVAGPKAANLAGNKRLPNLVRIVPLGASNAYLIYVLTRDNNSVDHPEIREAFGQTIALATGAAAGPRKLLNPPATGNWDTLAGIASGLSNDRAVFAWYETDAVAPTPGRFVTSAGVPMAANLDFACCSDPAQLTGLFPLPNGSFAASYLRNSIFGGANGLHGRVFKSNGQPLGPSKHLTTITTNPFIRTLSNGRIAVFTFVPVGNPVTHSKLVVQAYDKNWGKVGGKKTLIPNLTSTKFLDLEPTLDGGMLMARTLLQGTDVHKRSIRRLDANFAPVGADYTFASPHGFDVFRVAALSSSRAVVLFRNIVSSRHQLFVRILRY
jgi:hypothetical protein